MEPIAASDTLLTAAQVLDYLRGNPDFLAALWWDEMGKVFQRMRANGRSTRVRRDRRFSRSVASIRRMRS